MTREELKNDIKAYNTVRYTTQPHVTYFIKNYKDKAKKDGITLLQMNLPSSLAAMDPDLGLLTDENQIDRIKDVSKVKIHVFVAKTQKCFGDPKVEKPDNRYDCLQNGYWYSSEQIYDMLRIRKVKGYDVAAIYDFGIHINNDTGCDELDSPWLYLRYASLSLDYTIESLENEITEKWE